MALNYLLGFRFFIFCEVVVIFQPHYKMWEQIL